MSWHFLLKHEAPGEMSKSSLNALEYVPCSLLQLQLSRTQTSHPWPPTKPLAASRFVGKRSEEQRHRVAEVQMKAMEIGVTDASAENLRTVGFPEKMCLGMVGWGVWEVWLWGREESLWFFLLEKTWKLISRRCSSYCISRCWAGLSTPKLVQNVYLLPLVVSFAYCSFQDVLEGCSSCSSQLRCRNTTILAGQKENPFKKNTVFGRIFPCTIFWVPGILAPLRWPRFEVPVAELSTGWRMRLTLAVFLGVDGSGFRLGGEVVACFLSLFFWSKKKTPRVWQGMDGRGRTIFGNLSGFCMVFFCWISPLFWLWVFFWDLKTLLCHVSTATFSLDTVGIFLSRNIRWEFPPVAWVRSMLKHADIVLLDEPTNHLDQAMLCFMFSGTHQRFKRIHYFI